jgi:hypothetical protein
MGPSIFPLSDRPFEQTEFMDRTADERCRKRIAGEFQRNFAMTERGKEKFS